MAAALKKATGLDAELVEGNRGEFSIWVGESLVAQKDRDLGFPSEEAVVTAVQHALAK